MPPKPIPRSDDPPTPKVDNDKDKDKKKDDDGKENVQVCIRFEFLPGTLWKADNFTLETCL